MGNLICKFKRFSIKTIFNNYSQFPHNYNTKVFFNFLSVI